MGLRVRPEYDNAASFGHAKAKFDASNISSKNDCVEAIGIRTPVCEANKMQEVFRVCSQA